MNNKTATIIKNYEKAVNALAEAFLNKQFHDEEDEEPIRIGQGYHDAYWVGDDIGGVLCYGDEWFFNVGEMAEDLKEDAPKEEILKWHDYIMECNEAGLSCINYHSWLHGAPRRTKAEIAEAKYYKARRDEYINNANQNISYDYDGD